MAQLAIEGHATRGREVIELLEMLGGINEDEHKGFMASVYYFINDNYIDWCHECTPESEFISFSLEEFLEKFPYKVGDKVYCENRVCDVIEMLWNSNLNTISYCVYDVHDGKIKNFAIAEELKPYKEETMEKEIIYDEIDFNRCPCADKVQLILGDDFEIKVEDGKTFVVRKKPQYPKTFVECAKILNCFRAAHIDGYKSELLEKFQKLLVCRDAYWKIAGEQMGLGKPWKQDYDDRCFIIANNEGNIHTYEYHGSNNIILAFPTEEMRDAFYENFKDLIEQCKELL